MTRVGIFVLLALISLIVIVSACQPPASSNNTKLSQYGFVSLTQNSSATLKVFGGDSASLTCKGLATPHSAITWYRFVAVGGELTKTSLPVHDAHWSKYLYTTADELDNNKCERTSFLYIAHFTKEYQGQYYCRLSNGEVWVDSPVTSMTHTANTPREGGDGSTNRQGPALDMDVKLSLENGSALASWETKLRNPQKNFCKDHKYLWTIQVVTWSNWEDVVGFGHRVYEEDKKNEEFNITSYFNITEEECLQKKFDIANVIGDIDMSSYYKIQIGVRRAEKIDKIVWKNASRVHYFGDEVLPLVTFPAEGQRFEVSDFSVIGTTVECRATGEPEPRVVLLKNSAEEKNNATFKTMLCLAQTLHVHGDNLDKQENDLVEFTVVLTSLCSTKTTAGVCDDYVPVGRRVYSSGDNVTEGEADFLMQKLNMSSMASSACQELVKGFICSLYVPLCHPVTDGPVGVCSHGCDLLLETCGRSVFDRLVAELPSNVFSGNCSDLTARNEAGSFLECVHLATPTTPATDYGTGCIAGIGESYTGMAGAEGCLPWDQQGFYPPTLFPELQGQSCRNPGGSGSLPWCYTNLTTGDNKIRWKYCSDIPECAKCVEQKPSYCSEVTGYDVDMPIYDRGMTVDYLNQAFSDCFGPKCRKQIYCHLAHPPCAEGVVTPAPLSPCQSSCLSIKKAFQSSSTCELLPTCNLTVLLYNPIIMDCDTLLTQQECYDFDITYDPIVDPSPVHSDLMAHDQLILIVVFCSVLCVLVVVVIIFLIIAYCYYYYDKRNGSSLDTSVKPIDPSLLVTMQMCNIDNPDYDKTKLEKESLLNKSLRPISKSKIKYIRDLGSGNFGLVYQAKVEGLIEGQEFSMAAVKTLREGSSLEGLKSFLHEAKLACQFSHENIIKLHGICMSEGFYCLVFEYMDLGDLNEYLRCSASSLQRRIMNPLDSTSRSRTESSLSNNPPRLNIPQLVSICHQIACGMEYFVALHHVHRDLATRNCLMGTGMVVKIGDFGMSQTLYHSDYYKQKGEQALPVRWMAPEAFIYGRFSSEGDVWSFGVVMWEVFSFAMQPYYGKMNDQVMNEVRRGNTLEHPDDCPDGLYDIMRRCWQMEPHRRPTFGELIDELSMWKPTRCSTSTVLESQGSITEDSVSLSSGQDKYLELSVFDSNPSGDEEDYAN